MTVGSKVQANKTPSGCGEPPEMTDLEPPQVPSFFASDASSSEA